MKYIVIPIFKIIGLIVIYTIYYPIMYIYLLSIVLWEWDFSYFKEKLEEPFFSSTSMPTFDNIQNYYIYDTPLDWYSGNKRKIKGF
jgi:hypothetical protein